MKRRTAIALSLAAASFGLSPELIAAAPALAPAEIVAAAPASAWRPVAPENLLLMEMGDGRRVAIELAPAFAPVHVANVVALTRGKWFDGNAIVRVQDNYVTQWGGADPKRARPAGLVEKPPEEYARPASGLALRRLPFADPYAPMTGHADGWPVGSDGTLAWLTHCYGMVGVGRDMPPDAGDSTELYVVIGQSPRQLDRNIALVGRVVGGMDVLSSLPRGTGDIGFYTDPKQNVPIRRAWIAADMPAAERPRYEVMRTDSPTFAAFAEARANRRDAFYIRPAGGVDVCNVPVPTRKAG